MSESAPGPEASTRPLTVPPSAPPPTDRPEPLFSEAPVSSSSSPGSEPEPPMSRSHMAKLSLAAIGVVFGDIGTSPLYAMRECFAGSHAVAPTAGNVLGILSLIFWSLTILVSGKYVAYVLRADNKEEGGILALMALASSSLKGSRKRYVVMLLGVFGAALLYGDGAITPAISVLSAVEGLEVAAPSLHRIIIPLTIAILVGLFAIQRSGTGRLGIVFGPIMMVWFISLGVLGFVNLVQYPKVLEAVSPLYAARFLIDNGWLAFGVLGAVFLVVTGGEALYADLGHFGRGPIRRAWFAVVFPALFLNYLGQGALLLRDPGAAPNPFFRMAPDELLYPFIALSTCAAVIASQALISGVYSLTRQAMMLGLLPRMSIRHTSAEERGQIYVPSINWLLAGATIFVVLIFHDSSSLAAAYGIAVTLTMVITTLLACVLTKTRWNWRWLTALGLTALFLVPEAAFTAANLAKIGHGGWFPLLVGGFLFSLMTTWRKGRQILAQRFKERLLPLEDFFGRIQGERPPRVPGTAVFMTSVAGGTPPAMLHNFRHNHVLHEHVVLLTIVTEEDARVPESERFDATELECGFVRIAARYGFMEQPNAPKLLINAQVVPETLKGVTFFLGRETMIATQHPGMARWRVHLFAFLARNAEPATRFFNIPPDCVMEIGAQIEL
jgi:KUP system potassium uptake protein